MVYNSMYENSSDYWKQQAKQQKANMPSIQDYI